MHRPLGFDEVGGMDLMPFPFAPNDLTYYLLQVMGVERLGSEHGFHIGLFEGEQAITQFPLCRQTEAIAALAEGACDGGDDAHPSPAIDILVLLGRR